MNALTSLISLSSHQIGRDIHKEVRKVAFNSPIPTEGVIRKIPLDMTLGDLYSPEIRPDFGVFERILASVYGIRASKSSCFMDPYVEIYHYLITSF